MKNNNMACLGFMLLTTIGAIGPETDMSPEARSIISQAIQQSITDDARSDLRELKNDLEHKLRQLTFDEKRIEEYEKLIDQDGNNAETNVEQIYLFRAECEKLKNEIYALRDKIKDLQSKMPPDPEMDIGDLDEDLLLPPPNDELD